MELGERLRKKALGPPAIAIALVDFLSRQRSVQCVAEPSNQIFFSVIDQMSSLNAGPNFGPKLKNTECYARGLSEPSVVKIAHK